VGEAPFGLTVKALVTSFVDKKSVGELTCWPVNA